MAHRLSAMADHRARVGLGYQGWGIPNRRMRKAQQPSTLAVTTRLCRGARAVSTEPQLRGGSQ